MISSSEGIYGSDHLFACRGPALGQQLLLRWGQEQVDGARQALRSTERLLRDLRQAAQRHRLVRLTFP